MNLAALCAPELQFWITVCGVGDVPSYLFLLLILLPIMKPVEADQGVDLFFRPWMNYLMLLSIAQVMAMGVKR